MKIHLKSGITILELLIGVLIIGVVVAIFVYFLGVQRAISRDAKRVSDMSVLQASLSQYWLEKAQYPVNKGVYLGKPNSGADKLTADGFVDKANKSNNVFLDFLPIGPTAGEYYFYKGNERGYSLRVKMERNTAYGAPGVYYVHSRNVDRFDEIK